ncbi:MAG: FAD-dependent oxidoreductase, partial [Leeuwenhoekiella sp.]
MKEVDYIVVGLGLAGMAFCEQLQNHNKTFVVFHDEKAGASRVAGGVYNPVILKRYSLPWQAEEQFDLAVPYFNNLSEKLGVKAVFSLPVLKLFSSAEDQNNWFEASDKPGLSRFISPEVIRENLDFIEANYHFGQVKETGRVDISLLLDFYISYLSEKSLIEKSFFEYSKLEIAENQVKYADFRAKKVVFSEGYGIKENPYFSALPLVGNKGEYITIKAPKLQLNAALKFSFFIIPIGNDLYKVGATFNWKDKDTVPSASSREENLSKLKKIITCDFEVVD